MNFKKEFLLFVRQKFVRLQLGGILVIVGVYWSFLFSSYYQNNILPASQSWIAFLANLGFILLIFTYSSSTIGHCQIVMEESSLPFFRRNSKSVAGMLIRKFWFLFLINTCIASFCYWLFVIVVGSYSQYDFPFFNTIYFTLLFAGMLIQSVTFASSLQSLPDSSTHLPDKHALKGFVLALFVSLLAIQAFQYQIQIYLDYLAQEETVYPLFKMFYSLGAGFLFSIFLSVIYLESGYKNFMKRLNS